MASVKWKGLKFTLFFGRTNFSVPSFLGRRVQNFNYANDRFPRSFVLGFGNRVRPRKRNKIVDDRHLSSSPRTLVPDLAPDEISSVKCGTVLGTHSLSLMTILGIFLYLISCCFIPDLFLVLSS